jgi:hypothetical protein
VQWVCRCAGKAQYHILREGNDISFVFVDDSAFCGGNGMSWQLFASCLGGKPGRATQLYAIWGLGIVVVPSFLTEINSDIFALPSSV